MTTTTCMYIKTEKTTFIAIVMIVIAMAVLLCLYSGRRVLKTCPEYTSQKEAQRDLINNPGLDGDGDGRACNSYRYKT